MPKAKRREPLTEAQRALAAAYFGFASKQGRTIADNLHLFAESREAIEDAAGWIACHAAREWRPELCPSFATWLALVYRKQIRALIEPARPSGYRSRKVRAEGPIEGTPSFESAQADAHACPAPGPLAEAIASDLLAVALGTLEGQQRDWLLLRAEGLADIDIARRWGSSRQRVNYVGKQVQAKLALWRVVARRRQPTVAEPSHT